MFEFIKRWKELRRRKSILKDIKKAKYIYISGGARFMCHCFFIVDYYKYGCYEMIREKIPEFKPETFNVCPTDVYTCWWAPSDRESRIKAFDKLIKIYS